MRSLNSILGLQVSSQGLPPVFYVSWTLWDLEQRRKFDFMTAELTDPKTPRN
jgi:hypothetical protein